MGSGTLNRAAWFSLAGCVITIVLAAGSRTSLAAFIRPIEADLGLDRAVLSTAGALTVLTYGLGQPLAGSLATRFGPRRVMLAAVLVTALGGFGVATATESWQLYVFAGVLPGLAFAGASSVPAAVLLAGWFSTRLGLATGIVSSAIPAGQGVSVPLATGLLVVLGWRATYLLLALSVAAIAVPALLLLVREPPVMKDIKTVEAPRRIGRDVVLLAVGYFGCGFSDQFISIHLVALAADGGIEQIVAAGLLSLLLAVGILGSVLSGPVADRIEPKYLLAALYLTRAASLPLLLVTGSVGALAIFAILFGTTYIANQAPGTRLVRDRYGLRSVGPLMGGVGLAHQVGGAIGVAIGGASVVRTGSYDLAVIVVIVVVLCGGLAQMLIPPSRVRVS